MPDTIQPLRGLVPVGTVTTTPTSTAHESCQVAFFEFFDFVGYIITNTFTPITTSNVRNDSGRLGI